MQEAVSVTVAKDCTAFGGWVEEKVCEGESG